LHRRFRILAASLDMSYAETLSMLIDERERRHAVAARLAPSPLHRPDIDSDTDGDTLDDTGRML
jgi:hypothetical protein